MINHLVEIPFSFNPDRSFLSCMELYCPPGGCKCPGGIDRDGTSIHRYYPPPTSGPAFHPPAINR